MTDVWTHIVVTVKWSDLSLYVNGDLHDSQNVWTIESDQWWNDRLYIGGVSVTETQYDGSIDEIKVFNKILTNSQIESLYEKR